MNRSIVITTINPRTDAVRAFEAIKSWSVILVGDRKSQHLECTENSRFLSLAEQQASGLELANRAPVDHYCRKNVGYLYAMAAGCQFIYDTDDDNAPNSGWKLPCFECADVLNSGEKYVNVYRYFSSLKIWPRGFPLDELAWNHELTPSRRKMAPVGIWQGLADVDPDVDAIFRLVDGQEIRFRKRPPIYLDMGSYCPINSQNTFWRMEMFPLLYLPATVSFRFTDILRGYVAQKIAWHHGFHIGFTHATVVQDRNTHDLMQDFKEELECYVRTKEVVNVLEAVDLGPDMLANLSICYKNLVNAGIVLSEEMDLVSAWVNDTNRALAGA